MKNRIYYLFGILVALVVACSDTEEPKTGDPSTEVSEYLKMRFGNSRMESLDMAGANPAQSSYLGMMNNFGFEAGRLAGDSTDASGDDDSIKYEDPWEPWEWTSCAEITHTENSDGSITETYDYGDGCMEGYEGYQYLMKGKYTQTYKNNYNQEGKVYSDDYFYDVVYENYGGTYYGEYYENGESSWNIDGFSNYSGSSSYNEEDQTYTGSYTYKSETTYEWDAYRYYYKSDGSSHYDGTKSVSEGSYEYESDFDNYSYAVDILSPLVYDYSCYNYAQADGTAGGADLAIWFFTYVSGVESISFTEGETSGAFTIDYGDGECDNIVTITENGDSYTVDLGELYKDNPVVAETD